MKRRILLIVFLLIPLVLVSGCVKRTIIPSPPSEVSLFYGIHEERSLSSTDNIELFAQYWAPPQKPKASVLLLHGTTMHSGAYSQTARYLASHGYVVYGLDLRGWGRSEGRGSKGYVASHDRYVEDVQVAIDDINKLFPNQNLYVLGESLGATVAMYGYLKHDLPFDGMIFSGPGYKPNPEFLGIRGPRSVSETSMTIGAELGEWFPGWPTLPSEFGIIRVIDDPRMELRLLKDPHTSDNFLPAAYLDALSEADQYNRANIARLDLPLLILHGERDILIPVSSSQEIIDRAKSTDKTLKVYGSNHPTLLDTKRFQVFEDIVTWLDEREP